MQDPRSRSSLEAAIRKFFLVAMLTAYLALPAVITAGSASANQGIAGESVSSSREISAFLQSEPSGTTERLIRLQPGDYAPLVILGGTGPVHLVAADPSKPPHLTGLTIKEGADITFENVVLDYRFDGEQDEIWVAPFRIYDSRNIAFEGVVFDGDIVRGRGAPDSGFAGGKALVAEDVQGLTVENSEIRGFFVGLSIKESSDIRVVGNNFHSMRKDGINFAQVRDVLVEGNTFHSFGRSLASGDHSDMIQLWSTRTTSPSERVTIRNNIFNSGHGYWTQTIFFRNEWVDRGKAGHELFFRDFLIEGNVIINAHLHGISIGESDGLVIRNNTLIRNKGSEAEAFDDVWASPRIGVAERSMNVLIERNVAYDFPKPSGPDWTVRDNYRIQAEHRMEPGFYGRVFYNALAGDPLDLENFQYLSDGPLGGHDIGSQMLQGQGAD
ncbi:parallel beta-helix repeat protein [Allosediminivita pacifica]|uniref:Parallel beta-helix repeat protein n=1 Tax=Allosediminivita pacifica TaxID=1267769 RepID=A0A2T6AG42_9RHOB|nr:parallel beta-helix repeat protein [Allosediminivita pacifica]